MGKSIKISEYRERLDNTLASPELTNLDALKTLIRNQLLRSSLNETEGCSENVIGNKTNLVSSFLDMLRSASVSENEVSKTSEASLGEWKMKEDREEFRVMYRPGPQGTPFHTLLAEGYVDGTVDTCLCISWEAALYRKWWPQLIFPPFRITMCECLQKIRIGEQISLMRVKVTWPLTAREAVVHYFLFEYLQDGLVVAIVHTISDSEDIEKNTHGFTKDGIPEAKDVVRIDAVGGFAIQKVTSDRSYFRTIANIDLKLDFVPSSLINFISRQVIGTGFRLYQKTVASVSNYDEDYSKALEEPMYARIREALYSIDEANETMELKEPKSNDCLLVQKHSREFEGMGKDLGHMEQNLLHGGEDANKSSIENAQVVDKKSFCEIEEDNNQESRQLEDEARVVEQRIHCSDHEYDGLQASTLATDRKAFGEIEEEGNRDIKCLGKKCKATDGPTTSKIVQKSPENGKRNVLISSDVKQALETLEKAIYMVREYGFNSPARTFSNIDNQETPSVEKGAENNPTFLEDKGECLNVEVSAEESEKPRLAEITSHQARNNSSNREIRRASSRETNHNRITPASPEPYFSIPSEADPVALYSVKNGGDGKKEVPLLDLNTQGSKHISLGINGIHENVLDERSKSVRQKNSMFCCFGPVLGLIG